MAFVQTPRADQSNVQATVPSRSISTPRLALEIAKTSRATSLLSWREAVARRSRVAISRPTGIGGRHSGDESLATEATVTFDVYYKAWFVKE